MAAVSPPRPLAATDDRAAFDCGRDSLNAWFRRYAWINQAAGVSRVNVLSEEGTGKIVGFVTLSASEIDRAFLPKPEQRNRPPRLPATLLGQLAIDQAWQGRGYASALLGFALKTALAASESIASIGVLTHPIDDGLQSFYGRWGFEKLPFDPRGAMIIRTANLRRTIASFALAHPEAQP